MVGPLPIKDRRRARSSELGSSIVEMALASTILFAFIIGIMMMSLGVYSYHYISEAAREGTRYAIVRGSSAGSACVTYSSSACIASSANIQSYVKSLGFPGINANNMIVNPSWSAYPTGVSCTPSASCNNPGNLVTVNVHYTFPVHVPFVPSSTFTLNSTAAMVISQ